MRDPENPLADRFSWTANFFSRLHRYNVLIRSRGWIILAIASAAVLLQSYLAWKAAPVFVSSGKMIVNPQQAIPGVSTPDVVTYYEELNNFYGTQILLMQSEAVATRAQARVKLLEPTLTPCRVDLKITQSPKTSVFVLRAVGADTGYTRAYLNAVMEEYIRFTREQQSQSSDSTLSAITEELRRLDKDLRTGEEELMAFRRDNNIVYLEEQGSSAGRYLVSLNTQLADLKAEYKNLETLEPDQAAEPRRKDGIPASDGNGGDALADYLKARRQIQILKAELEERSLVMRQKHPKIVQLIEEMGRQENLLKIYRQQITEQGESRRKSVRLQIQNLEALIKEWEVKSLDATRRMADYQRIQSRVQRAKTLYDRLLGTVQSVDVGKNLKQERVAILEKATPPVPERIGLVKGLIFAALLGFGGGVAILLLIDRLDDRPTSFTELETQFDEPILAQIPLEKQNDGSLRLLDVDDQRHAFAEAYRNLRSALLFMANEGNRPKTLLITSAIPNEGKSTIASDLAITLAQGGSRELLVDADLRRGIMHRAFKLEASPGLAEALSGQTDWTQSVQPTHVPNLTLLSRGTTPKHPGELFLSAATKAFLDATKENYDYVILDSAPALATDDSSNLAPKVDGVLFVIRSAYTSARLARHALDQFYHRQARVLGMVFNSVDMRHRNYYYYKYSAYYHTPTR